MAFAAATKELEIYARSAIGPEDVDIAMATSTLIVKGVFVAQTAAAGQYHYTARDTGSRAVAGVAMETRDARLETSWTVEKCSIRVRTKGLGVFPVATTTSVEPDTSLYVLGTGNGNTLTDSGNVVVGKAVCACKNTGELDPTGTSYAWVDFDPKKY